MAEVTINGILSHRTKTRGTSDYYVRTSVINTADVVKFTAAGTAGSSVAGTQTVNFGGTLVGATDAGLGAGTFTSVITIDNTASPVSITLTGGEDVDAIVTAINVDLPGTECALTGGNLVVTSGTTGESSYVLITETSVTNDSDIFANMTGFVSVDAALDGGTAGQLRLVSLANGSIVWDAYGSAEEVFNSAADSTVVASKYTRGNLNATFSDTEVEAELDLVKAKLDALQNIVEDKVLNK